MNVYDKIVMKKEKK